MTEKDANAEQPLEVAEYDLIGRALMDMVSQCPELPKNVPIRYQQTGNGECIGVFTLPGSKYLQWYVDGGFAAQVQFQVAYKSFPASDAQRIASQAAVDAVMAWLESTEPPTLTGGRKITRVTASNSIPYKDAVADDGSIIFAADAIMEYRKKGVLE